MDLPAAAQNLVYVIDADELAARGIKYLPIPQPEVKLVMSRRVAGWGNRGLSGRRELGGVG